jgi:MFS family permease
VADAAGGAPLARVITFVYAGYSAGSIISPAVGGWLAQMTNMRTVYLLAAVCYAVSTLVVLMIKPRPVQTRTWQTPSVHVVRSNGLLALIVFAMFLPLYIGIPLAPNYMRNVAGWPMDRIGLLGTLYALGLTALSPTLGRLSTRHPIRGLLAGQALVWVSLSLLFIGAQGLPAIAFTAFFLRGGYGACRSLAGAQIAGQASAANRGAAFGLAETSVASAQMVAPYLAGWLYDVLPAAPIFAGLALIPAGLLLTPTLGRQAQVAGRKAQPPIVANRPRVPSINDSSR